MVPESDGNTGSDGGGGGVGGFLGRGWRPSRRVRALVFVGVGLLLLVNPLVGGLSDAVGLTGSAQYTAVEVVPGEDGERFSYPGDPVDGQLPDTLVANGGSVEGVDCYDEFGSVECTLERELIDGNLTVESGVGGWYGYTHHGRFYERVSRESGESVTLALRPVAASAVLANVSTPVGNYTDGRRSTVRTAVESGTTWTDPTALLAGDVVEYDGVYYVIAQTDGPRQDEPPGPVYSVASAVAGTLLVQRGWRVAGG